MKILNLLTVVVCCSLFSVNVLAAFTLVAVHPEAQSRYESGHGGAELGVLREYNNRIYIGYGQDGGGVIPGSCTPYYISPTNGRHYCDLVVRYLDTTTDSLSSVQATLRSQEIDTIEVMGGNVYLLAEDRDGLDTFVWCSLSVCGNDNFGTPLDAEHVYSAANVGNTIYMAGSARFSNEAVLWRSTDNGITWTEFHKLGPAGDGLFARFYHVGVFQGDVYIHRLSWGVGNDASALRYDGNSWQPVSPLATFTRRMREFDGSLIYKSGSELRKFSNGTYQVAFDNNIQNWTISDGWLYILQQRIGQNLAHIYRTKDLNSPNSWRYVDTAPSNSRSIEVSNGALYVGTRDSQIYKSDKSLEEPDLNFIRYKNYLIPINR